MRKRKRKNSEKMSVKKMVLLLLIVLFLGIGTTLWYYAIHKVVLVKEYRLNISVVNATSIGFNADPTLHFGKMTSRGGVSEKKIMTQNEFDFPVLVKIRSKGEADQFFSVKMNDFILEPGKTEQVSSYMSIPPGTEPRVYLGWVKITYIRQ